MARIDYIYLVDGKEVTLFDLEMATGLTGQALRMRFKNPRIVNWVRIPRDSKHLIRTCSCCKCTYIEGMGGGRMLCTLCHTTVDDSEDEFYSIHLPSN